MLFVVAVLFVGQFLLWAALAIMLLVLAVLLLRIMHFIYKITGTVHRKFLLVQ
ncbi:hypothetical protein D3C79_1100560 [compost metagenome]